MGAFEQDENHILETQKGKSSRNIKVQIIKPTKIQNKFDGLEVTENDDEDDDAMYFQEVKAKEEDKFKKRNEA